MVVGQCTSPEVSLRLSEYESIDVFRCGSSVAAYYVLSGPMPVGPSLVQEHSLHVVSQTYSDAATVCAFGPTSLMLSGR